MNTKWEEEEKGKSLKRGEWWWEREEKGGVFFRFCCIGILVKRDRPCRSGQGTSHGIGLLRLIKQQITFRLATEAFKTRETGRREMKGWRIRESVKSESKLALMLLKKAQEIGANARQQPAQLMTSQETRLADGHFPRSMHSNSTIRR